MGGLFSRGGLISIRDKAADAVRHREEGPGRMPGALLRHWLILACAIIVWTCAMYIIDQQWFIPDIKKEV